MVHALCRGADSTYLYAGSSVLRKEHCRLNANGSAGAVDNEVHTGSATLSVAKLLTDLFSL